ncbi:hypothetical protein VPNG_01692 [Cytospora leucostoma]|uniref:Alpha-1,3-mannosyltransferase n=1 Tax=Cytospora leucostoma TaxID=1230097 RepID=A0A423XKM4_9PEZI|nr:hypothetical protein VPNG_01692 [Cytospora leucostoma]
MPPHLHPRSRMTSSLFATTALGSFFVVALPHLLPCPAPRVTYADGEIIVDQDGRRRRRRRPTAQAQGGAEEATTTTKDDGVVQLSNITQEDLVEQQAMRRGHECPVPKPGGKLGELLGFHQTTTNTTNTTTTQHSDVEGRGRSV